MSKKGAKKFEFPPYYNLPPFFTFADFFPSPPTRIAMKSFLHLFFSNFQTHTHTHNKQGAAGS